MVKRYHLFELEDQPWLPKDFRNWMTDLLHFQLSISKIYSPIVNILYDALLRSRSRIILDLASGGGGSVIALKKELFQRFNYDVHVRLSDLYPNQLAMSRIQAMGDSSIEYLSTPIDATNVPKSAFGFRTLFTSFHHFNPELAQGIIADAVHQNCGIGIFELSDRSVQGLACAMASALGTFLVTPFLRPFSWSRLFFTYMLPAVPTAYAFDGLVSQLRSYKPEELLGMAKEVENQRYIWFSGTKKHNIFPVNITYLVGYAG